jgi:cytochrome c oxidase cbb3-type subunit I/II
MLNDVTDEGVPKYAEFLETVQAIHILWLFRAIGGTFYLLGWFLMIYNLFKTIKGKPAVNGSMEVTLREREETRQLEGTISPVGTFFNAPFIYSSVIIVTSMLWMLGGDFWSLVGLFTSILTVVVAIAHFQVSGSSWGDWYERLIGNWIPFTVLTFIAVAIGGAIQIIPGIVLHRADNVEDRLQIPYTPLELAGRDIYVAEGCYNCHSQMIRTIVPDVVRYGDYSRLGESIYDHPFQWGSKRTGPDLAREGGKRPDVWHYDHMLDPRSTSPGSNMPAYPWLFTKKTNLDALPSKIAVQRMLGVPFPEWTDEEILAASNEQAAKIVEGLTAQNRFAEPDTQIIALIAYLQKLGAYEKVSTSTASTR